MHRHGDGVRHGWTLAVF